MTNNTDIPIEIRGYASDPKRVGYQLLTNYESTYWGALVGAQEWRLYEALRSFCHQGKDECTPSLRLLLAILGIKDKKVLTGRTKKSNGKVYEYPGLISTLEEFKLVKAELVGEHGEQGYIFHVNLTPGLLTPDQLAQLPKILQKKHQDLIQRWKKDVDGFEALTDKNRGGGNSTPPRVEIPPGPRGNSTPITTTNKQDQTNNSVVVNLLTDKNISEKKAHSLVDKYDPEHIREKVEYLEWKLEQQENGRLRGRPIRDSAGWLVRAIQQDYQPPSQFKTRAQREAEKQKRQERQEESEQFLDELESQHDEEREQEVEALRDRLQELRDQYETTDKEITLWEEMQADLEGSMARATYQGLFAGTHLLKLDNGSAVIAAPNKFVAERLKHHLNDKLERAFLYHLEQAVTPEFVIINDSEDEGPK